MLVNLSKKEIKMITKRMTEILEVINEMKDDTYSVTEDVRIKVKNELNSINILLKKINNGN